MKRLYFYKCLLLILFSLFSSITVSAHQTNHFKTNVYFAEGCAENLTGSNKDNSSTVEKEKEKEKEIVRPKNSPLQDTQSAVSSETILHYLGNEAVLVEDKEVKFLFDPFFHNHYGQYILVPDAIRSKIFSGQAPFDNITAIFVSHVHGDHFDAKDTLRYLKANKDTLLFIPEQGRLQLQQLSSYNEIEAQVRSVELKLGDPAISFNLNNMDIDAVYIPHAGWPQRQDIQNTVFRISTPSNFTVAHFGDADANPTFYRQHHQHWKKKLTDVALVPYWLALTPDGREVINSIINSKKNIGVHVPVKGHPALPGSWTDYFSRPGEQRAIKNHRELPNEK
ncbi:MAG: MBL fold metallo-hydrolase [Gammaproteobacteria bacterium]|nr:MBL fold metallo-hydrolase [Gammaproteobacteria bacterium]